MNDNILSLSLHYHYKCQEGRCEYTIFQTIDRVTTQVGITATRSVDFCNPPLNIWKKCTRFIYRNENLSKIFDFHLILVPSVLLVVFCRLFHRTRASTSIDSFKEARSWRRSQRRVIRQIRQKVLDIIILLYKVIKGLIHTFVFHLHFLWWRLRT